LEGRSKLRVWDVPVERLCRQHLLGQHNEIHAMFSVITKGTKGWSNHPETKRWKGKLKALYLKHNETAEESVVEGDVNGSIVEDVVSNDSQDDVVQEDVIDEVVEEEAVVEEVDDAV